MTLGDIKNELRPLISVAPAYDPRPTLGKFTAGEVLSGEIKFNGRKYKPATLAENMFYVATKPEVSQNYRNNKEIGNWAGAVYFDEVDGQDVVLGIPYGVKIVNDHTIEYKSSEGPKEIDLSKVVRSEQEFLKVSNEMKATGLILKYLKMPEESGWTGFDESTGKVWDYVDNYGFATKVFPDTDAGKRNARNSLLNAFRQGIYFQGFTEECVGNLLSYQSIRQKGTKELVPVVRFSDIGGGPANVGADWDFRDFDSHDVRLGCLFVGGSEQISGQPE